MDDQTETKKARTVVASRRPATLEKGHARFPREPCTWPVVLSVASAGRRAPTGTCDSGQDGYDKFRHHNQGKKYGIYQDLPEGGRIGRRRRFSWARLL